MERTGTDGPTVTEHRGQKGAPAPDRIDVPAGHWPNGAIAGDDDASPFETGRCSLSHELLHRGLAIVVLAITWPLILGLMALVRFTSPGPAIYSQLRVGRHGRTFRIYKIRSMPHNVEHRTGAVWASPQDNRATWVGRWLRALHLDELPQLVNVIRGDMSLVGPRPERPEFTHRLAREIPGYLRRLDVRPGITGLSQVNLPPDSDVSSVRRKVVLDTRYVERQSAWLDVRIIAATLFCPLGATSVRARRLLRVYHHDPLPNIELRAASPVGEEATPRLSSTAV
jgi:lipopolysaccharide/colanic/teichoic acid biosynthesis glycosyltransferase